MQQGRMYVSELSASRHTFWNYHFCRGNSNKRKTRLGIIRRGQGAYVYLNKALRVKEGDLVFIPESIYCYSEWRGEPEIEVLYLCCFMHYEGLKYEPQTVRGDEEMRFLFLRIADLLSGGQMEELEAYSLFYKLLQGVLPQLRQSSVAFDKTLQTAIEYITTRWNEDFSVAELAKACCVSESTVYHLFQKELGQTPVQFLNSIRINVAIEHLENSNYSVSTISRLAGFHSENHFRHIFTKLTGLSPLKFRKNR